MNVSLKFLFNTVVCCNTNKQTGGGEYSTRPYIGRLRPKAQTLLLLLLYRHAGVLLENIPLVKFIKTTSGIRVVYFP